jgi:hypothetical protein
VLGIDFCHNATQVNISRTLPSGDVMSLLKRLPRLKKVRYPWTGPQDREAFNLLERELPGVEVEAIVGVVG